MFDQGRGVKWNGKMWVAVGVRSVLLGTIIAYSYDGICWKRAYKPTNSATGYNNMTASIKSSNLL